MKHTNIYFLSAKDIPYTLDGKNIIEFRKADLRRLLGAPLGIVAPHASKNDLLKTIVAKLDVLGAPAELTELELMSEKKAKPKAKPKAKKKGGAKAK